MKTKNTVRVIAVVVILCMTWLMWLLVDDSPCPQIRFQAIGTFGAGALTGFRGNTDTEFRRSPFEEKESSGFCNLEALVGMPREFILAIQDYVDSVHAAVDAIGLTRRHYYDDLKSGVGYPYVNMAVYEKDVRVSVVILPRPESVMAWSESPSSKKGGWISLNEASHLPRSPFGYTIFYQPGVLSTIPWGYPAFPRGHHPSSSQIQALDRKFVAWPEYMDFRLCDAVSPSLRFGRVGGAVILSEIVTVSPFPDNPRLRWTSIRSKKGERHFLAYALVDGNGCFRRSHREPLGSFIRPLTCAGYHLSKRTPDSLLLPTPLIWAPTGDEMLSNLTDRYPFEDWCLDDWFPAQKDACWVLREAEDSKPLQESFVLMPASEKSDRPVFFIALFAETEPKQLIKELAALYKVSPDKALNSPETMARLQALYEKVRDFPLDK